MKGFVINLKRRPDRLKRFVKNVQTYLSSVDIEVIEAEDGNLIDLQDKFILENVNEWNFKFLKDRTLKGVIGCCLSHLKCYEKIINSDENYSIIFEDDCSFNRSIVNLDEIIRNLVIPEKFGIIFLNESMEQKVKRSQQIKSLPQYNTISHAKTTESYIISKEFAKIMYDENIKNIGAIDSHMAQLLSKYPEYPYYELKNPLFFQHNRRDTDIQ
jgi:glycosyl transferase family 25